MSSEPRIVLDCRWLNSGGAGRVSELLLRGLARQPGSFRWILWGPAAVAELAWPGSEVVPNSRDPRQWNGQRSWFDIPACDAALFVHQQRPLRRIPAVTMIHDTIPLRFTDNPALRALKKAFLRRVVAISESILTPSEYSKRCIVADLGARPEAVEVVKPPTDPDLARRVAALRRSHPTESVALYLGLFLPHKNLPRLIEAFGRTAFRRDGGRLLLMGGLGKQPQEFLATLTPAQREYVEVRGFAGQPEVELALATCRYLVLPSLEEGFGLPAWEALSCGVPLCASDGGALPEIIDGWADQFPATSIDGMIQALDRCAVRAASLTSVDAEAASRRFLEQAPAIDGFAGQVLEILEETLRARLAGRSS